MLKIPKPDDGLFLGAIFALGLIGVGTVGASLFYRTVVSPKHHEEYVDRVTPVIEQFKTYDTNLDGRVSRIEAEPLLNQVDYPYQEKKGWNFYDTFDVIPLKGDSWKEPDRVNFVAYSGNKPRSLGNVYAGKEPISSGVDNKGKLFLEYEFIAEEMEYLISQSREE